MIAQDLEEYQKNFLRVLELADDASLRQKINDLGKYSNPSGYWNAQNKACKTLVGFFHIDVEGKSDEEMKNILKAKYELLNPLFDISDAEKDKLDGAIQGLESKKIFIKNLSSAFNNNTNNSESNSEIRRGQDLELSSSSLTDYYKDGLNEKIKELKSIKKSIEENPTVETGDSSDKASTEEEILGLIKFFDANNLTVANERQEKLKQMFSEENGQDLQGFPFDDLLLEALKESDYQSIKLCFDNKIDLKSFVDRQETQLKEYANKNSDIALLLIKHKKIKYESIENNTFSKSEKGILKLMQQLVGQYDEIAQHDETTKNKGTEEVATQSTKKYNSLIEVLKSVKKNFPTIKNGNHIIAYLIKELKELDPNSMQDLFDAKVFQIHVTIDNVKDVHSGLDVNEPNSLVVFFALFKFSNSQEVQNDKNLSEGTLEIQMFMKEILDLHIEKSEEEMKHLTEDEKFKLSTFNSVVSSLKDVMNVKAINVEENKAVKANKLLAGGISAFGALCIEAVIFSPLYFCVEGFKKWVNTTSGIAILATACVVVFCSAIFLGSCLPLSKVEEGAKVDKLSTPSKGQQPIN